MLRIGKLTDYAVLILGQLAKEPDTLMSTTALAEALHLTSPTVSKILKMLADAEIVTSVRGAEGGYLLAKEATRISVADVIAAMEGGVAMTECCDDKSHCLIDSKCTMRGNWQKINRAVYDMLSQLSIVDMSAPISLGGAHGK